MIIILSCCGLRLGYTADVKLCVQFCQTCGLSTQFSFVLERLPDLGLRCLLLLEKVIQGRFVIFQTFRELIQGIVQPDEIAPRIRSQLHLIGNSPLQAQSVGETSRSNAQDKAPVATDGDWLCIRHLLHSVKQGSSSLGFLRVGHTLDLHSGKPFLWAGMLA